MPTIGPVKISAGTPSNTAEGYRSKYDKSSEQASAGYYSVHLTDYDIKAEATVARYGGVLRFTFPENDSSHIQIDLARRVGGTSTEQYVHVVDDRTIRGWMRCTPDGGGWGNGGGKANYTVHFYAQFSRPFDSYGFWSAEIPDDWKRKLEEVTSERYRKLVAEAFFVPEKHTYYQGKHIGFVANYATKKDEVIEMKAGISFVDMEGAERNFRGDLAARTFDQILADTKAAWNAALGKIRVQGGTEDQKTVFYTALYHTMIDPRDFTDIDGRYWGGDNRPHQTDESKFRYTKRTIFSGWDVFRSQMPLQTLINPNVINDTINSLVSLAEESGQGRFERWEFLNAYSGCMIGNPAISVLLDARSKGIAGFDAVNAYKIAKKTALEIGNGERGYSAGGDSISNTLEYAYSDWCMSKLAEGLGALVPNGDAEFFAKRAQAYRNVFDSEVGWFRPRNADGSWQKWPERGRLADDYGCVESNPYQQGWFVPHDVEGMVEIMGGRDKVLADLIEFFEKTPKHLKWNSYYNHANEPVHHVPFLFNRLGKPDLTQFWTRHICQNAYKNSVDGLCGNEDVGQMSAWFVLASIGIHQLCPGDPNYEITSPLFDEIAIQCGKEGQIFTIKVHNNSPDNVYIDRMLLNGLPHTKFSISHNQLTQGGMLEIWMKKENES